MDKFKEKIANLRAEADDAIVKAEQAEQELTAAKAEISAKEQEAISLTNRIALLESQLERAETTGGDSMSKLRELESKAEEMERKVKSLENENEGLEVKLEEKIEEHSKVKAELDETIRAMDDM